MPLPPDSIFELSKAIWTEEDFDQMGWHDATVHALAFSTDTFELLLDIDYIYAWVDPKPPEEHFNFWISPCTLVFSNVYDFSASIELSQGLEVSDLSRVDETKPRNSDYIKREKEWKWIFDCQQGELSFRSVGFQQITRKMPTRGKRQSFSWEERGNPCFDRSAYK
ncbi:MAG: hypothetical protein HC904_00280 [Blastochloris sp.]|nr:hypothetical protein [Blastochloris sp.]